MVTWLDDSHSGWTSDCCTSKGTGAMSVYVREANLIDDGGILTDLAHRYLNGNADENRFRWLYAENPFGPARAWIACEKQGEAIGMAAVFPRRMYRNDNIVSGCVLGDLCISPKYRSVGPALQLQRACLACARSGEFAVAYDFPSTTMSSIYQHLGLSPIGKSVRLAKTLRADKKVERALRSQVFARPATAAVNRALALADGKSSDGGDLEFRLEDVPCGSEYSRLAQQVGSSFGICTVRTAEYLNWRYWRNPGRQYEFLTARRGNRLLTYCAFTVSDVSATVAELFGDMAAQVVNGLLRELARSLRIRGVATVSVPLLSTDPRIGLLRKLGFWAREAVPVMGFAGESTLSSSQMFLMHGDRES
jgi:Acetyltransferase (GNAT) domain